MRDAAITTLRVLAVVVALLSTPAAHAQETPGPMKARYVQYCASCHGVAGKGDGPAAPALKTPPTDLTALGKRAGGRFPLNEVMTAIDGRRQIVAHGSREMPVWGARFKEALAGAPYPERTTLMTVRELAEYLATIQE